MKFKKSKFLLLLSLAVSGQGLAHGGATSTASFLLADSSRLVTGEDFEHNVITGDIPVEDLRNIRSLFADVPKLKAEVGACVDEDSHPQAALRIEKADCDAVAYLLAGRAVRITKTPVLCGRVCDGVKLLKVSISEGRRELDFILLKPRNSSWGILITTSVQLDSFKLKTGTNGITHMRAARHVATTATGRILSFLKESKIEPLAIPSDVKCIRESLPNSAMASNCITSANGVLTNHAIRLSESDLLDIAAEIVDVDTNVTKPFEMRGCECAEGKIVIVEWNRDSVNVRILVAKKLSGPWETMSRSTGIKFQLP